VNQAAMDKEEVQQRDFLKISESISRGIVRLPDKRARH
jgi:hypothetical protein